MLLNNVIKLGSAVVVTGIKVAKISAPYVTKGVNASVSFAKKEKALAKHELGVQGKRIKSDYAATKVVMSKCKADMANVFAAEYTVEPALSL